MSVGDVTLLCQFRDELSDRIDNLIPNRSGEETEENTTNDDQQQVNDEATSSQEIGSILEITVDDDEDIRLMQEQLLYLLHAQKCQRKSNTESKICRLRHCISTKLLLRHVENCSIMQFCPFPSCTLARLLLEHFENCKWYYCGMCAPLKPIGKRNQRSIIGPQLHLFELHHLSRKAVRQQLTNKEFVSMVSNIEGTLPFDMSLAKSLDYFELVNPGEILKSSVEENLLQSIYSDFYVIKELSLEIETKNMSASSVESQNLNPSSTVTTSHLEASTEGTLSLKEPQSHTEKDDTICRTPGISVPPDDTATSERSNTPEIDELHDFCKELEGLEISKGVNESILSVLPENTEQEVISEQLKLPRLCNDGSSVNSKSLAALPDMENQSSGNSQESSHYNLRSRSSLKRTAVIVKTQYNVMKKQKKDLKRKNVITDRQTRKDSNLQEDGKKKKSSLHL